MGLRGQPTEHARAGAAARSGWEGISEAESDVAVEFGGDDGGGFGGGPMAMVQTEKSKRAAASSDKFLTASHVRLPGSFLLFCGAAVVRLFSLLRHVSRTASCGWVTLLSHMHACSFLLHRQEGRSDMESEKRPDECLAAS